MEKKRGVRVFDLEMETVESVLHFVDCCIIMNSRHNENENERRKKYLFICYLFLYRNIFIAFYSYVCF